MAIDWTKILSASTLERMEREKQELIRLYGMPDRFLARAILNYARGSRDLYPDAFSLDPSKTWHCGKELVWNLVPELAYRLGETDFQPNERKGNVRTISDEELRNYAYCCIAGASHFASDDSGKLNPYNFLLHSIPNGNPVAIAVERLSPASAYSREDKFAATIHEISSIRGFEPPFLAWEPAMQDYKNRTVKPVEIVPDPASCLTM